MSIKKNFLYNIFYQLLIMIIPLITTPYISRVLGAEGIGIQSYTLSIANYFVLFAMLGINNHGNRSIAMNRDDNKKLSHTFWSIYIFQLAMSLLVLIIYIIYIVFFAKENKMIFIIQTIYIISALLDINWLFFGLENFKITVIRNMIIKLISTGSIFILVNDSNDLYIYSLLLALSNLLSQVVLWMYVKRYIIFMKVSINYIIRQIRPILVLFIPVISISIYKLMDKIMLGSLSNMSQVAFYENSERIINIPMGIVSALGVVMLPRMSSLQSKGADKESKRYMYLSIQLVMIIAIGATFGLIGISSTFIPLFLGEGFIESVGIVKILSPTIMFLAWANVIRTQYLIPKKLDSIYIKSTILGAIVNLFINLILIKSYAAIGAAIGTIFAEATVAIYQTIKVRGKLEVDRYLKSTTAYIIPGIIMYIIIGILEKNLNTNVFIKITLQVFIGGTVYLVLCLIYMIITRNEIATNLISKFKIILNRKNRCNNFQD